MSHDSASIDHPPGAGENAPPTGSYVVVARRYRPRTFGDLVGQEHLTRALTNAITTNRVGHAYLFTGARGVGKTSTARIFAKALNAPNGPTAEPDNDSDICRAIDAGEDVDVLEIDGASNRGIDEIRQLRSNANVRPSRARYKIYIIDEVHMLTTAAFNALLKTLEEPPPHVKFILCTTDPQKIPITVLSRCQRYDFAPVEVPAIVQRLSHIVTCEGRTADLAALELIARRAEGSMRDSQSLLEQLLAFCGGTIAVDDVHQMLGTAASHLLSELTRELVARHSAAALARLDEAIAGGVDCGQLAEQLLGYLRDLLAAQVGCGAELIRHASPSDHPELQRLGTQWGLETTMAAFEIVNQAVMRMRQTTQPRLLLEIALVRICNLEDLEQLSSVIAQLQDGTVRSDATSVARTTASVAPAAAAPAPAAAAAPVAAPSPPPAGAEKKKRAEDVAEPAVAPVPPVPTISLNLPRAEAAWKQVLSQLGDMTADYASHYDHLAISAPDSLVVHFRKAYTLHKEVCEQPDRKMQLERQMGQILGGRVRIDMAVMADTEQAAPPPPPSMFQLMREKESHPWVRQAVDLFDAEVTKVDVPRGTRGSGTPAD